MADEMQSGGPIRIGTRASLLATTQTGWVVDQLRDAGVEAVVETVSTSGDERRDLPVSRIGGDGVFVRELEQALLEGRIDAAVHSLKDMPTAPTPGLELACIPRRASPFDAIVGRTAARLEDLPPGAVVGTSSIRRVAQVKAIRDDLVIAPVRGNVDTRLGKLDAGEFDALILAAAGLERLGLGGRITDVARPPSFWPAVAQGALAIQTRADDDRTREAVTGLDHPATHLAVIAERRMLADLAGGCLAPIGGWARIGPRGLTLGGCVLDVRDDGSVARLVAEETVGTDPRDAENGGVSTREAAVSLGSRVAVNLLSAGAAGLLEHMRHRLG